VTHSLSDVLALYDPASRARLQAAMAHSEHTGEPWDLELPLTTKDGRALWVRFVGEIDSRNGPPGALVGAVQDVTEQHQRRLDLQREHALRTQSEQHAQALDQLLKERGDMLDVLAHEVRQPLNNASAVLQSAAIDLAQAGDLSASGRLQRARNVMGHVLANIDNTLAVAALLAHAEPIAREDTDVDTLLAVAIADLPVEHRSRCQVERLTGTRTASMDMGLMRLAVRNLLANALRHSPPAAPVLLRVSDSDEPLALIIDVVDQGGGIDAALLPRLFQRGSRGRQGDHGVGLYIVRRVMELHGGSAELFSTSPQGTTMRLVLSQSSG
jgi:signal transduction histidine kinase